MGLGRPSCLRYSDWHTCRDRVPSLLGSLLGMRTGHCIWLFEDTSKDAPPFHRVLLPYAEQPASFLNNPFYLLDTPVHLWCTFFSNSCECQKNQKELMRQPSAVFGKGPGLKQWVLLGRPALCTERWGRLCSLPAVDVTPAWLYFFLFSQSNQ